MPSASKAQATLMAMAAHSPAFAKKRGVPVKVARDFNRADKRTGILRKGAGGRTPMESGMDATMNFGMGHGGSMFSTTPLMGHALSGTQLGQADRTIRNAQSTLARFADGGEVTKPAKPRGPSAKERREIRAIIERGKDDAVAALRQTRHELLASEPEPSGPEDALERLTARLRMQDGGAVEAPTESPNPEFLYEEYTELLEQLQDPKLDTELQTEIIDRLAAIEDSLEALGLPVGEPVPATKTANEDGSVTYRKPEQP